MTIEQLLHEAKLGGPGFEGYAYRAAYYCIDCGFKIIDEIAPRLAEKITDTTDPLFSDSETIPQPIFFAETDCQEFCDNCHDELPISVIE